MNFLSRLISRRHVPPPTPQPRPTEFTRLPTSGRAVCAWRGVASATPFCVHTLRIEHLRAIAGEPLPWSAFEGATHHLWILYRLTADSPHPIVLVSQQFDFNLPQPEPWQTPDWVASQVGEFLIFLMPTIPDSWLLRHSSNRQIENERALARAMFWADAVDRKFVSLRAE